MAVIQVGLGGCNVDSRLLILELALFKQILNAELAYNKDSF